MPENTNKTIESTSADGNRIIAIERNFSKFAFYMLIFLVGIFPFISYPKEVTMPISGTQVGDVYDFFKTRVLYIISALMLIILVIRNRIFKKKIEFNIPLLLFILWAGIATLFSEYRMFSLFGYPARWQGLITYISYATVFTFVYNVFDVKYLKPLLMVFFGCGIIMTIYAIFQFFNVEPMNKYLLIPKGFIVNPDTIRGTLGNRNFASSYFLMLFMSSLFLYFTSKDIKKTLLLIITSSIFCTGVLVCLTRSAWVAAFVGFIVCCVLLWNKMHYFIFKIAALAVLVAAITITINIYSNSAITSRFIGTMREIQKAVETKDITGLGSTRGFIYKRAIKITLDNPLIGVGPDCLTFFATITDEDRKNFPSIASITYYDKVHNEYLEYASTMGIPALIFYGWFIAELCVKFYKKRKSDMSAVICAVFAAWLSYIIQASANIGIVGVLPIFFTFTGILYLFVNKYKPSSEIVS